VKETVPNLLAAGKLVSGGDEGRSKLVAFLLNLLVVLRDVNFAMGKSSLLLRGRGYFILKKEKMKSTADILIDSLQSKKGGNDSYFFRFPFFDLVF
jgi:hypothetical protein